VANVNDAPTGSVTITGTPTQGQTLTAANTLADADGLGSISYQWRADGSNIANATGSTFTLTQAQVGKAISVVASYTDGQGTQESVSSSATTAVANVNDVPTGTVTITGTPTQGQVLTASNTLADADGLGTISYQWKAAGEDIAGATASTFTLTQAQVGKAITVVASYTDGFGSQESKASASTTAVANVNDAPTGSVTITGTPTQGQTLTAANTLADADGLGSISYQWKAAGEDIAGATASTFTLTQAQVGKAITVLARYTDGQGTPEAISSAATGVVADNTVAPNYDGDGDGVADVQQTNVASLAVNPVSSGSGSPPTPIITTLVASPSEGSSSGPVPVITSVQQKTVEDAVQSGTISKTTPEQMQALLGLIGFTAEVEQVGQLQSFTLFVSQSANVNGYWKLDSQGTWANLASEPYGGSTTVVGDRLRLDFQIRDGGEFDYDGVADGTITDPGALANMTQTLTAYRPDLPNDGFWF
jgi:hypothetical protein